MSIKYRGFVFEQINVFGRAIPCKSCIEQISGELSDSSKLELHIYSNEVVSKLIEQFNLTKKSGESMAKEEEISILKLCFTEYDRALCEIIGFDFPVLMQSITIHNWFTSLIGNFPGNRMQNVRKLMSTIISLQNGCEISDSEIRRFEQNDSLPDYSNLDKHSEYLNAKSTLASFGLLVDSCCKINPVVSVLRLWKNERISRIATLSEGQAGSIIVFCPYCRCLSIEAQSTRQNVHCVSAKCGTKDNTTKKSRSREEKKLSSGWEIGFDRKSRRCKECKMKRLVSPERVCKECFKTSLPS
jgi:hypothetical protein